jgi:hypothetical protein
MLSYNIGYLEIRDRGALLFIIDWIILSYFSNLALVSARFL